MLSLDSIVSEYLSSAPHLFFFYPNHIYGVLQSIVSNYSTGPDLCMGTFGESASLGEVLATLDNYIDAEYSVNAIPAEINKIMFLLNDFVLDDILARLMFLFSVNVGDFEFRVTGCRFLAHCNDMVVDIVFL